jgi:hypothetical protein
MFKLKHNIKIKITPNIKSGQNGLTA